MRTQPKSQAVVAAAPDATATLVRTIAAVLATATLLFLFRPTVVPAQDKTAPHTVSAGETLWLLAARFYGDGQKWTELAKLNGLGPGGEKQLVVGQLIKVPAGKPVVAAQAAVTPPPNTPRPALQRALQPSRNTVEAASPTGATGVLAQQTAGKTDAALKASAPGSPPVSARNVAAAATSGGTSTTAAATPVAKPPVAAPAQQPVIPASVAPVDLPVAPSAPLAEPIAVSTTRIWATELSLLRNARGSDPTTVFLGRSYDPAETDRAVKAATPVNRVLERAGEYTSAPYAVLAPTLTNAGTVGRRAGSAGGSFRDTERFVLVDEAEVTLPVGVKAVVGARLVSVELGSLLKSGALVLVPTGVLEVISAEAGRPVVARVVRQSGRIEEGQQLVPLEGSGIINGVSAKAIPRSSTAPETEVTWVEGALLPTLQSYVMLGSGEREGVKPGDEFALVTRQGLGVDAPELRVAVVRVIRVTLFGSTAIVVRQDAPTIAVGGAARLVARVP